MKKIFLLFALDILLTIINANAQQPLNLNFEKLSIEGLQRPWGWQFASFTTDGNSILDSAIKHSGKYSLHISDSQTDPKNKEYYSLRYLIEPYSLRSKVLKIKGWLKTYNLKGNIKISIESYKGLGILTDSVYSDIHNNTTSAWTSFDLEMKVSSSVHSVYLTIGLNGAGTVWFDDINCFINNKKVDEVEAAQAFNTMELQQLSKHVVPFNRIDGSKENEAQDFSDLEPFNKIVGSARIVALGESTHGTGDFFKMKHRALEYAVKKMGFSVFALEANQLNVERINNYVHKGIGDPKKLMARSLFAVWNTEEILDLIKWVRFYNTQHASNQIDFVGYDMQEPLLPIDSLNSFLTNYDTGLQTTVSKLLFDYKMAWQKTYYPSNTDSVREIWKNNADKVWQLIAERNKEWFAKATSEDEKIRIKWAVQNARVIQQAATYSFVRGISYRDSCMAENIKWILDNHGANTKCIVWAHDTHICKAEAPVPTDNYNEDVTMGNYLSKMYGNNYRAFGMATYQGTYTSTISYTNFKMVTNQLYPSPRGSLDAALHRLTMEKKSGYLIADLRAFRTVPNLKWLLKTRPVRFITYATSDYGYEQYVSIPYQFNAIIFIDKTNGSKILR